MFEEEVLSENLSTVNWSGPPNPQMHSDDEEDFLSFSRWDKFEFQLCPSQCPFLEIFVQKLFFM